MVLTPRVGLGLRCHTPSDAHGREIVLPPLHVLICLLAIEFPISISTQGKSVPVNIILKAYQQRLSARGRQKKTS